MAFIIFLVLALGSAVSAQKSCQDLLGNCHQMPSSLCTEAKSQKQMRNLCAKTCGYCPQAQTKTRGRSSSPIQSTTDIFLLYLKNDVKFLKEEITDIKLRLRDVISRQKQHARAINKGTTTSTSTADTNDSGAQVSTGPLDDTLAKEIIELKRQAQRLTARIQDQNDRYASLDSKFNEKLSNANDQVSEKMKSIRGEIASLSNDLKKYAEQIADLSDVDDELANFKVDSESRTQELRRTTILSIEELKNFTTTTAQRFLNTQRTFYDELDKQRQRSAALETKFNNLEQALQKEQKRTSDLEQLVQVSLDVNVDDADDVKKIRNVGRKTPDVVPISPLDGRKLEELANKFERVSTSLDAQTKRTDILTTLVAALSNNLSNVTTEQRNIRRYLAYQYAYIGRHMKGLVSKLNQLERFSQEIINRTLSKVSASTSTKEEFSQLSTVVYGIFGQLKSLRLKGFRSLQAAPVGQNSSNQTSGGLSAQNLEILRDMSQDIDILKKKVAYGAEWMKSLDVKVQVVSNKSADGISAIKKSIQEMAVLRNNESISLENINSKFQQGIAALLGPQRSNATRFFNPRFDWETSKLAIYGYVAMNHQGEWGTICDDNFDDREAEVLCRMAGYKGGRYDSGKYKVSDGKISGRTRTLHRIWIDELHCEGTENAIEDCQSGSEGWGIHDCDHDEDVGIKCYIS